MAVATLERCYNNPQVFKGVVKIRKGEAVRLMMEATNMAKVKSIMTHFTDKVKNSLDIYICIMSHAKYHVIQIHSKHA